MVTYKRNQSFLLKEEYGKVFIFQFLKFLRKAAPQRLRLSYLFHLPGIVLIYCTFPKSFLYKDKM